MILTLLAFGIIIIGSCFAVAGFVMWLLLAPHQEPFKKDWERENFK